MIKLYCFYHFAYVMTVIYGQIVHDVVDIVDAVIDWPEQEVEQSGSLYELQCMYISVAEYQYTISSSTALLRHMRNWQVS